MPLSQEMETGRFTAEAEDGTTYVVLEVTNYSQIMTFAGPAGWVPTGKALRLLSGTQVEAVEGGAYRIAGTSVIIHKVE